ncbi:NUDIX domain-containing protein [Patescibacteria group bacterium]|jgi:diadenosine hexaphosphate hydrolase (ATP-forming)|uniref:NUDIX domain-containing protein n=1 Tax=candidate division WWE3 bacterium TaxID=2053526 RepID=A0A928TUN5_UNCKA|nr:NUDIX domain-containing protein [candidate division WWE3 bacterium]MCL4732517.1 NUDIX domain-containing protein [Patescibacteria group bacterium]MDL1952575.1 NUDIX domain-containing protein [Candidatus Uhrbacteria bacterium UHB]RIL01292.1 MAG: hypothetical protein DCC77_02000 [Candidatus Uhrbacteria bacterium]
MQTKTPSSKKPSSFSKQSNSQSSRRAARKPYKRRALGKPTKHELSAGGIIYRKRNGQVEVFFIKDPYGRWTFPKGHQELGETLAETAVREIREETNLEGLRLVAPLGRTSFTFRRDGNVIEKTVYLFLFEAPLDAKEKFTGEGAIWEGAWMQVHKAFNASGYRNLDRLLGNAMRIITEKEGGMEKGKK